MKGEGADDFDRDAAFKSFDIEFDRWSEHVKALSADSATWRRLSTESSSAEKDSAFCKQLIRDADEVKRKRPDEGEQLRTRETAHSGRDRRRDARSRRRRSAEGRVST